MLIWAINIYIFKFSGSQCVLLSPVSKVFRVQHLTCCWARSRAPKSLVLFWPATLSITSRTSFLIFASTSARWSYSRPTIMTPVCDTCIIHICDSDRPAASATKNIMQKCFQLLFIEICTRTYDVRCACIRECSSSYIQSASPEEWERRQLKTNNSSSKKKNNRKKNKKCHRRRVLHHWCYSLLKIEMKETDYALRPTMRRFFGIDMHLGSVGHSRCVACAQQQTEQCVMPMHVLAIHCDDARDSIYFFVYEI